MMKTPGGLKIDEAASVAVGPVTVVNKGDGDVAAYFNRGILLSQFMARRLGENWTKSDLRKVKEELAKDDNDLRSFLSGQLGAELSDLLDQARSRSGRSMELCTSWTMTILCSD